MYIQQDPYASYKLLKHGFEGLGYTVTEDVVDEYRHVTYTSPAGKVWRTRAAHLRYPQVSDVARRIILHKEIAYAFAHKYGMPIPYTRHLASHEELSSSDIATLFERHKTLIVKPASASLSRGLTLNITTPKQLQVAIKKAFRVGKSILIQEQVDGEEVRFAVLDGKVVAALLRRTPQVIGDGVSTIAELIDEENQQRASIKLDVITYPQLDESIIDTKLLTSTRVPRRDELVELSRATMIKNGCSVYDVLAEVHPSYIEAVEELVGKLGAGLVVVDLFVKDFTKPRAKGNYWFIEFNSAPVLKLFYSCRDGNMFDIVPRIVQSVDAFLHQNMRSPQTIFGSFEPVCFVDLTDEILTAKIDTGAYSGALHAADIQETTDANGRKCVSFSILGDETRRGVSYSYYKRKVRSAHGHTLGRYVIQTKLRVRDKLYEIDIGLSDRVDMKYPVLIGRKFLRDNNILVDVSENEALDYEKELLG